MSINKFRNDINGLRAYAVILVVLFHFQIFGFSAGYLGVDIFFVISGYLMTKIIIKELKKQQFSFTDFYLARIVRIFPALLFLILFLTILGWFIFIPEDFKNFAKDARYSLTFLSNDLYYRQAGDYFAADTHDKALLHTWSLSVEWQFYLLFPLLLFIYSKFDKQLKYIGILLGAIFIASLSFSILMTAKDTMYGFFKLTTRMWELIAGGLVYYYFDHKRLTVPLQKLSEGIGFSLILLSLVLYNPNTAWPSFFALLPVAGTIFILIANRQDSIFTQTKIIQNIGSASYSIYLWHWPVFFLLNYFFIKLNFWSLSISLILSFLLGWLSYKYIESSRKPLQKLNKRYIYFLFAFTLLLLYPTYKHIEKNGLVSREKSNTSSDLDKMQMPSVENGWCFYNIKDNHSLHVSPQGFECSLASKQKNAKSALLFGDSFAGHNSPFWDQIGKKLNLNIQAITTNWCYPSLNKEFTGDKQSTAYQQCLLNREYLSKHIDQYDVLIFAGRWSDIVKQNQQQGFANLLQITDKNNKKVIVMSEPYAFNKNISLLFKRAMWLDRDLSLQSYMNNPKATEQKRATKIINEIVSKHPNTILLTQQDLFKSDQMATNKIPYSLDGRHISIIGSLASAQYFEQQAKYMTLKQFISE
jgi:peptidoglycan/LPS O-acetylase OafA/YrhL